MQETCSLACNHACALPPTAYGRRHFCRPSLNVQKRGALLVSRHVAGGGVPSIEEANAAEQMLLPPSACRPRVQFGCSLDEALEGGSDFALLPGLPGGAGSSASSGGAGGGGGSSGGSHAHALQRLVPLYAGERFLLTWRDGTAYVMLQEAAAPVDLLRAMWQAAWLEQHGAAGPGAAAAATAANGNGAAPAGQHAGAAEADVLAASLEALRQHWPDFAAAAAAQGWQLEKAVLPRGRTLVRLE